MPSPELAGTTPLTDNQLAQLAGIATSLSREQAIWLSGYFAGLGGTQAPPTVPTAGPDVRLTTILVGSETGNCREVASALAESARAQGIETKIADMADYKPRSLKDEGDLLVITSTHGEGDPPQTALDFFEFLAGRKAPKLPELRFAVLALGDSTYEHFCAAGRQVDSRLEELGGTRLTDLVECDVDYDDDAEAWVETIVSELVASAPAGGEMNFATPVAAANGATPSAFSKKNPFQAEIIENIELTGRGSTKETRHVELSLEGSGLEYRPGDVLGVMPQNDPELVSTLLERLSLSGDAEVTLKKETVTLREALTSRLEITAATPRFLEQWGEVADSSELRELATPDRAKDRIAYLNGHHVLDVVERHPVPGLEPDQFVAGLRPLQPRLYSIASSLAAAPDEVHLTVSTVRYSLHDTPRTGVATGFLAGLTGDEDTVPVYVQSNDHFHLPGDDTPILMIGAGTGVAPYRSFMQEREARGVLGKSWLFFGERNFRSDFLYQLEWQDLFRSGVLDQFDLAFSRDSAEKVYVQDRLRRRGREVYSWLEEGAFVYVCGDANHMAPDVHAALVDIVAEHGGQDSDGAEEYLSEMRRSHRYRLDVY
ncbi:MAG: assimilatory sulfite reductase (NADPH) flavoprotein subunit [Solirubrobacterales bacterium]|nr:assimilatory sulfite reductase (NADPH) flavoprotein subunit [Solirubrobacterales bacterium]